MSINDREKKVIALQGDPVRGEKLKGLLAFCLKISEEFSLSTIDRQWMTMEEAKSAMNQYSEIKIKRHNMDQEAIDEMLEMNVDWLERSQTEFGESCKETDNRIVRREVTCMSHCTSGSPHTVYYFKTDEDTHNLFEGMKNLYDGISLGLEEERGLEDPGFYQGGEVIASICSHESLGYLLLSEEEYKEFKALRIPHRVRDEEMSLREYFKKCAYEEWESLTILGWRVESIPEEIGEIKSLKKLEIFDHSVKYLPKSIEELTELECLRITGNQVEELGFDVSKLKKLKVLDFGGMPLKQFPKEILLLKELEKVYLGDIQDVKVPENVMELTKLKVLSLPKIEEDQISIEFKTFLKEIKPTEMGVSLREILGEEKWQEIIDKGDYIICNED